MGLLDDAIKEHLELKRRRGADAGEISRLESEALGPVPRSAEGVPDMSDTFEPSPGEPAGEAVGEAGDPPTALPPTGLGDDDATAAHAPPPPLADEPLPPPRPAEPPPPVMPPAVAPPQSLAPPPSVPPPDAESRPPSSGLPEREPWMTDDPVPEPAPAPGPEPEPEHGGLFSRLRGGRRSRHEPERPGAAPEPAPPEPGAFEPPASPHPSYAPQDEHEPDIVPADDEPDGEELLEETPEFLEETPEHDRLWFEQRPPRDFNFDD
jgi:hypothetical protein